jgi:hypothetical protein
VTIPGSGKRVYQVATRIDEATLEEIDRYQRDVERRGRPRSRSLTILDLLIDFAKRRREEREAQTAGASNRARVDLDG